MPLIEAQIALCTSPDMVSRTGKSSQSLRVISSVRLRGHAASAAEATSISQAGSVVPAGAHAHHQVVVPALLQAGAARAHEGDLLALLLEHDLQLGGHFLPGPARAKGQGCSPRVPSLPAVRSRRTITSPFLNASVVSPSAAASRRR